MKKTNVLSCTGGGGSFLNSLFGFTMAEILLSLTIIGVVAAITLPSLTGNINERTWATQKKALYARMSQAFPLLDSINTYNDAESFIAGALNTVTKINNVCSQKNLADCGINTSMIAPLAGTSAFSNIQGTWSEIGVTSDMIGSLTTIVTSTAGAEPTSSTVKPEELTAAFETGNGESIILMYNPNCVPDQELSPKDLDEAWFDYVCVNMIYDLNNNKGPNTVGKDIGFMTVFYPTDSVVVSANPDLSTSTGTVAVAGAGEGDPGTPAVATSCRDSEYRLPNKYEAISMALNARYVGGSEVSDTAPTFVTSSKGSDGTKTYVYLVKGTSLTADDGVQTGETRCVKR